MEPKDIFAKAHINTCAIELEHNIEPYAKAYIDNNVVGSEHTFENCIDNSIVEPGHTFTTFAEACATIEKYAAQTKTVIILGKTTRNLDNSGYRQALFVYERQGKYNRTNDVYRSKRTGCPFAISINYRKQSQQFIITKFSLVHNHKLCSDAVKFSTIVCKLDKDDLGLIESLHDNGLRTKDIFSVLASVSSKYIHKPNIYNAVSCQYQHKLQGLNEIKMLFKTLYSDENIIEYAALKDVYGTERDQDSEFV
ncbi:7808_t:CDS:1 [Cetraspora pellucida]|uniref:7808_t:CDS:1 n=1 Tax=Cetraspora pellucida TaxID=1433469 RepID=A0A9N9PBT9_9GLOM|nr:7808_t:CDS:1 [Cetraspora pellucida]